MQRNVYVILLPPKKPVILALNSPILFKILCCTMIDYLWLRWWAAAAGRTSQPASNHHRVCIYGGLSVGTRHTQDTVQTVWELPGTAKVHANGPGRLLPLPYATSWVSESLLFKIGSYKNVSQFFFFNLSVRQFLLLTFSFPQHYCHPIKNKPCWWVVHCCHLTPCFSNLQWRLEVIKMKGESPLQDIQPFYQSDKQLVIFFL